MATPAKIDRLIADSASRGDIPGVSAMATNGRDIVYQGAAGVRALGSSEAMTIGTVCNIASMTKPITGVACMQLVEQGRVGLDDDMGRIVPALAAPRVLEGFDAEGKPRLRPAKGPITLRQLLTHTAGFVYDMWNEDQKAYMAWSRIPRAKTFQKPEDCLPLAFDPGTRWEYGVNIDWAGKVVEALTGMPLDDYMQQNILQPLCMRSTGYRVTDAMASRLAGMHQRHADGRLERVAYQPASNPDEFLGGGGLNGTVEDYVRFMNMMLGGGTLDGVRILKPETVKLMGENHIGAIDVQTLKTARPNLSNDANLFPGMRQKWGLTFLINTEDVPGRRAAGSLAWAGLRNTYFWIDPTRGVAGALMTQILPFADPAVLRLFEAFETATYEITSSSTRRT